MDNAWVEVSLTVGEARFNVRTEYMGGNPSHYVGPLSMRLDRLVSERDPGFKNPACRLCGSRLLRWGWYASPQEPVTYWYCLDCDREDRQPCIQVHQIRIDQVEAR